jgi:hypothetical protein
MADVARLAKVLSNARRYDPHSAETHSVEKSYEVAMQRYTNPFRVNKYMQ